MNYESRIKNKIKILQPEKLDPSLFTIHNSLFDFFIVAAYAKIIPQEILDIPLLGTIGVHPSLLPKYRGASPIQSAVLNGEETTGVTLYYMDDKMDHGPILAQQTLGNNELGSMNYEQAEKRLAELSANLLAKTLPKFLKKELTPLPQDETRA